MEKTLRGSTLSANYDNGWIWEQTIWIGVGDIGGMVDQDGKWGIRMKWWIQIGVGVVDMDEVRLAHMDRDRGKNWGGKCGIFLEKGHYYKGRKRFRNGGYYTLYQLWLQ